MRYGFFSYRSRDPLIRFRKFNSRKRHFVLTSEVQAVYSILRKGGPKPLWYDIFGKEVKLVRVLDVVFDNHPIFDNSHYFF